MRVRKEINYYNMLGLHPDVNSSHENYEIIRIKYLKNLSDKDIKVAYRNLSKKFHPDKNGGDDIKFKEIVEAYKVLSNKELKEEYDRLSKHGLSYDVLTELYEFEFSNETVSTENFKTDVDKFKKKELINILIEIDEFQSSIEYERYIGCKHCDGTGVNPAIVDMFDCDFCDGEGKDRLGKKCLYCNGKGKASLGFENCPKCEGNRIVPKKETVKIKEKDFKENKLVLKFKGNASKVDQGKVGNLYIKLRED